MRNDSFDNLLKENKSFIPLGNYGEILIETFKKQNSKREKILRDKEELLWKYKHSKPPIFINPWKATNHQNEYFNFVPFDKVYSFNVEKKQKNLLHSSPFFPQRKLVIIFIIDQIKLLIIMIFYQSFYFFYLLYF